MAVTGVWGGLIGRAGEIKAYGVSYGQAARREAAGKGRQWVHWR